jgi:hypothetical protein
MSEKPIIPAISREVDFIARNITMADAICDGDIRVAQPVRELTAAVYHRANGVVEALLLDLEAGVDRAVRGVVRIKWTNGNRSLYWGNDARIFNAHGRKKQAGWAGLT